MYELKAKSEHPTTSDHFMRCVTNLYCKKQFLVSGYSYEDMHILFRYCLMKVCIWSFRLINTSSKESKS